MRRPTIAFVLTLCMAAQAANVVVPWDQAEEHVGENVTVEGRVMGVHCSPTSCLLAFDPTFNRFTAVVQAERFDVFPPDSLDGRYTGRRVRVTGKVRTIDKKPEIVLDSPDALQVVQTKAERQQAAADAADTQTQILERLDQVLQNLTELTERMADAQARMESLLANIEARTQALAAATPVAPQAPPPPNYGEPLPRPAYEALRTVKRGMSADDVSRLIGEPQAVEQGAHGWTTWYYGYGRSVSFDPRGRAQSMVGFPPP